MRAIWGVGVVLGLALLPAVVLAQDVKTRTAVTESDVQALVQAAGYKAVIASDDQGPYIDSAASGQRFYIGLYGCDEATPKNCNILGFLTEDFAATAEVAKAKALVWNNSTRWWSRALLDEEGNVALVYNVSISGGVTDGHIDGVLSNFIADIEDFQKSLAE